MGFWDKWKQFIYIVLLKFTNPFFPKFMFFFSSETPTPVNRVKFLSMFYLYQVWNDFKYISMANFMLNPLTLIMLKNKILHTD